MQVRISDGDVTGIDPIEFPRVSAVYRRADPARDEPEPGGPLALDYIVKCSNR
jgi:hypothetical protein